MKIAIVAAHPDDECLGAGGTIAWHHAKGDEIHLIVLGEGPTSREDSEESKKAARSQLEAAAKILGVHKIYQENLRDQCFDQENFLELAKKISSHFNHIKPAAVYTHHPKDLNRDHQICAELVLVASRSTPQQSVQEILFWENLSSSEWAYKKAFFHPQLYIDISQVLDKKLKALQAYSTELQKFPHPRSLKAVEALAQVRGSEMGVEAAEAFEVCRILRK